MSLIFLSHVGTVPTGTVWYVLLLSGSSVRINAMVGISVEPLLDIGRYECVVLGIRITFLQIRIRDFEMNEKYKILHLNRKILFFVNFHFLIPMPLLTLRTSKLQEKLSALKREHLAFQNMTFLHFNFLGSFLSSWIKIRIQLTKINAYPDPQHW